MCPVTVLWIGDGDVPVAVVEHDRINIENDPRPPLWEGTGVWKRRGNSLSLIPEIAKRLSASRWW